MATTTSAKAARKAAREATLQANADLARRTKLNMENLTTFFAATARADAVDEWLNDKIVTVKEQARQRRDQQRRHAGFALREMRNRGESIRDIAQLAGIRATQARELIRLSEIHLTATVDAPDASARAAQTVPAAVSPSAGRKPVGRAAVIIAASAC